MILDWRKVADTILSKIKIEIQNLPTWTQKPKLAVVLVWENSASLAYIRMKEKRAQEVGMLFELFSYPDTLTQIELESEVLRLSKDDSIHGLIIQAPLPAHIDRYAVTECINPTKDVDGFTKTQIGNMYLGYDGLWSCTPKGIMTLLAYYNISVTGKNIVVIGRSNIVGKPMSLMLINAWATVTSCNSNTTNLREKTKNADIIIVAAGSPGLITREMVQDNSIVIDVGNTFIDGVAHGDSNFDELKDIIQAITPTPGWVGPMTVATLIANTWKAYMTIKK